MFRIAGVGNWSRRDSRTGGWVAITSSKVDRNVRWLGSVFSAVILVEHLVFVETTRSRQVEEQA